MKKIIIILTINFIFKFGVNAQCIRLISTDPNLSTNSTVTDEISILVNNQPSWYKPYNRFDWRSQYIANSNTTLADVVYVKDKNQNPILTDYFVSPYNPANLNVDFSFLSRGFDSDNQPSDGWELVKVDLGYFADGTTLRNIAPNLPYFLLYNRYSGILRFFGTLEDPDNVYKTVNVHVSLMQNPSNNTASIPANLKATNLLSIAETLQPLDQHTKIFETNVNCTYPGNNRDAFWFDIPLAYDPCICKNQAILTFEFTFLNEASFTATGILNNTIIGPDANGSKPKTLAGKSIKFAASVGMAVVTGGASLRAEDFSNALSLAKDIPGLSQSDQDNIDKLQQYVDCGGNFFDKIMDTNESWGKDEDKEKIQNGKDIALAGYDFYTSFTEGNCSDKKQGATFVSSKLSISGKIESVHTIGNTFKYIAVPGSTFPYNPSIANWSNTTNYKSYLREEKYTLSTVDIPEYPLYNEALGTIAFLKTPELDFIVQNFSFNNDNNM